MNSEKRKKLLLLLKNGPKDMGTIMTSLGTKRTALLPQLKIMEEKYLLIKDGDTCELTVIGQMLAERTTPLLGILDFFDGYNEYWGTHDLDFIPSHLLKRITEIGPHTILEPPLSEIFEMNKVFEEGLRRTRNSTIVTSIIYPDFLETSLELIENGIDMEFIATPEIIDKIRTEEHDKFKRLVDSGQIKYFLYNKKMCFPAFAQNDDALFLLMAKKDGSFENRVLMARSPGALAWGKELFEHYRKDAVPISDWEQFDRFLARKEKRKNQIADLNGTH